MPQNADRIADSQATKNVNAWLWLIRRCEGTSGPDGYNLLFGGQRFKDLRRHPNIRVPFTQSDGTQTWSTAAGAYQILYRTWLSVSSALRLTDFSPSSQDQAAIELTRRRGALDAVKEGDIERAIDLCAAEWASLPGSRYGQPTRSLAFALEAYTDKGGSLA